MDAARAATSWSPYQSRPGRRVLVIGSLADLQGPTSGSVVLPLRLCWSPAGRRFEVGNRYDLRAMYQFVLNEAIRPEELTAYLDGGTLVAVWPDLSLPKGVRRAWEERHPALRAGAVAA